MGELVERIIAKPLVAALIDTLGLLGMMALLSWWFDLKATSIATGLAFLALLQAKRAMAAIQRLGER